VTVWALGCRLTTVSTGWLNPTGGDSDFCEGFNFGISSSCCALGVADLGISGRTVSPIYNAWVRVCGFRKKQRTVGSYSYELLDVLVVVIRCTKNWATIGQLFQKKAFWRNQLHRIKKQNIVKRLHQPSQKIGNGLQPTSSLTPPPPQYVVLSRRQHHTKPGIIGYQEWTQ